MTLHKLLLETEIIKDDTEIYIRDSEAQLYARGKWFQDNLLEFSNRLIHCFRWEENNSIFIELK